AGEIRDLCKIARPRVGVVTNVGYAHIEAFDSIDEIAAAKRELVEALPEEGIAILNADDPRVASFYHPNTLTFGIQSQADVRAEDIELSRDHLTFRVKSVHFETR